MADTVRCAFCRLNQYRSADGDCRRCRQELPPMVPAQPISRATISVLLPADAPLPTLQQMEWVLIGEALRRCSGDKVAAANMLGIGKTTLYRKLNESAESEAGVPAHG
jgi:DNA-binding NtrC family response regulator